MPVEQKGTTMPFDTITHRINVHTPIAAGEQGNPGPEIDVRPYDSRPLLEGQTLHEESSLVMHWTNNRVEHGGSAQACIRMSRAQFDAYVAVLAPRIGEPNPDGPVEIWVDFHDRHELNNLIRVSRRARDQVFGKDE